LSADPDPGLWLNTDPGSGSQYLFLIKQKNILHCIFSDILQHQYLAVESYVIQKNLFEVKYKGIKAFVSQSHFLYELKKSNYWIQIRDPHSEYGSRIRIPEAAEYGSNADPDPKHCYNYSFKE